MLTISVTDFRGCARAEILCDPLALVAGRNAAGKSSLAQGVASALSGKLPVAGRGAGAAVVRFGAGSAAIEVRGDAGFVRMTWPAGQPIREGAAPEASEWACGAASIVNLSARDRARVLADYLRAEPTRDELADALARAGIEGAPVVTAVWSLIEQHGWDGAESLRRERGAQMKGQWRQITNQTYGSRVAANWRPDLAELNDADLTGELARAKLDRDRAVAAAAVSADERKRAEADAGELDQRTTARRTALERVAEAERTFQRARDHRQTLPPSEQPRTLPCPYCCEPIILHHDLAETRLERATGKRIDDDELRSRRMAIAKADGELSHADGELGHARREAEAARLAVEQSEAARDKLANWPRAVESGAGDPDAAAAAISRIERQLAECRTKREADDIHAKIEGNEIVIGLLAGDGLRAAKLARVVNLFTGQTLGRLAASAGWSAIGLDAEGGFTYGDRPYELLSSSEQFRVRVTLQIAMAQLEGAGLVVIDAADILDAQARGGLFALLAEAGLPALVCMTLSRPEQMPDLAAAGVGRSYWIDGGSVSIDSRARAA